VCKEDPLQLKLDHLFKATNVKIEEETFKYMAIAVRAEDCLNSHLANLDERNEMKKQLQNAVAFGDLSEKDFESPDKQRKQPTRKVKKATAVQEALKYGKRK